MRYELKKDALGTHLKKFSSFVTGPNKFDTKDFIWTLYRPLCEARLQQGTSLTDTNGVKIKKSGRMPYVCVRENAVNWCK